MAITLNKATHIDNTQKLLCEYVCDTADDVTNLPTNCRAGSMALCIANGKFYVITSTGTWTEIQ